MATAAPPICPHCGYDLMADRPIERDGLWIDPALRIATWNGQPLGLPGATFTIIYSLVKAWPAYVRTTALAERIGYEGDAPDRMVKTYIHRLRKAGLPIRNITAVGYAWHPTKEPA